MHNDRQKAYTDSYNCAVWHLECLNYLPNIEPTMPATRIALILALKQAPHPAAIARQCFRHTTFSKRDIHLSKCYAKEERETFTGQLYASTAQRLERERAEQRRFASARAPRGGRSIGLSFGLPP